MINIARFCFGLNMFTTLPLELFVCREVIEQYFFSHEAFSMQRHVFFTTVIIFASMLSAQNHFSSSPHNATKTDTHTQYPS